MDASRIAHPKPEGSLDCAIELHMAELHTMEAKEQAEEKSRRGLGGQADTIPKNRPVVGSALHSISRPLISGRTHLPPPEGHAKRETAPSFWGYVCRLMLGTSCG
jgi:hypothetical protein